MTSERECKASPWRVLAKVLVMFSVVFPSLGSMLLCPNAWSKRRAVKGRGAKPELARDKRLKDRLKVFIPLCLACS